MTKTTVIDFARPSDFSPDSLTDVLRGGARELLDDEGHQRLVRHGSLPERDVMTRIGKVPVQVPRVRDRGSNADGSKSRLSSSLVLPYLRNAKIRGRAFALVLPQRYLFGGLQRGPGFACLSPKTALSMVFKLMMSAKKKWRKLSGTN